MHLSHFLYEVQCLHIRVFGYLKMITSYELTHISLEILYESGFILVGETTE